MDDRRVTKGDQLKMQGYMAGIRDERARAWKRRCAGVVFVAVIVCLLLSFGCLRPTSIIGGKLAAAARFGEGANWDSSPPDGGWIPNWIWRLP